jgi:hypothetical protein
LAIAVTVNGDGGIVTRIVPKGLSANGLPKLTVGLALTVIVWAAEVAVLFGLFFFIAVAFAVNTCWPDGALVHTMLYGEVVSVPINVLPLKNSTLLTV